MINGGNKSLWKGGRNALNGFGGKEED